MEQQPQQVRSNRNGVLQVLDGSEIRALVENKEAFAKFVDDRFRKLDGDGDGRLSVKELQPVVADIGAAIGLPARGSSQQADHIYAEVLSEFTHGKQDSVSKSEFQRVLSDILLGMAAGLKRDPIVILRINGEDLKEFVDSPRYEPEAAAIFAQVDSGNNASLHQFLLAALRQLTVDHGMPPACDSWVQRLGTCDRLWIILWSQQCKSLALIRSISLFPKKPSSKNSRNSWASSLDDCDSTL